MSLISTYQSRKSLFAEKLITKGVEASATDGLTTLINKIGDISTCNNGLLFAVDKTIAQSGGTVNLSAMILKDGIFQVGETVNFYTGDVRTLGDTVSQIDLGGNAWKLSIETVDTLVQFGQSDEVNITKTNDGYNITDAYQQHTYDLVGDYVCFDGTNLVLYNDVDSCDISDFEDIDTWESNIINKIYYYPYPPATVHIEVLLTAVTGSNGVASVQYSCTGSGLKNFYATSGTFVSETLPVIDAFYLDNVTSNQTSNYFLNTNNNSLTYNSNGYYILQSNATGTEMYVDLRGKENLIKGRRVRFEADLELNGNTITMAMTGSGITSQSYSTDGICYIEGDVPSTITTTHLRISKTNANSGDSIKIKSIRVYYK